MMENNNGVQSATATTMTKIDKVFIIPHIDELPGDHRMSTKQHMIAGAAAGLAEHIFMFPVDTIKTRMQTVGLAGAPSYQGITSALSTIARYEGMMRLFRGVSAVVMGAVPSHACYFATYEIVKKHLQHGREGLQPISSGIAGVAATAVHDAISTPMDVVKQRMQCYGSTHRGVFDCIRAVFLKEGIRAFFVSYPTTLIMNVPFASVHFASYETFKHLLKLQTAEVEGDHHHHHHDDDHYHAPWRHFIAGGCAGAIAAGVSTPLDVIKTRLQTQGLGERAYAGIKDAAVTIWREDGYAGFLRGIRPRMLYHAPSAAICWMTYEYVKFVLGV